MALAARGVRAGAQPMTITSLMSQRRPGSPAALDVKLELSEVGP